jgi:hypothetical protein
MDTGKYLGCVTWGFSLVGGEVYPEPVQGTTGPSNNFNGAVDKFNQYFK